MFIISYLFQILTQVLEADYSIDKMPDTTALYDHRNWTAYLFSFRQSFKFLDSELTDPHRFPKGKSLFLYRDVKRDIVIRHPLALHSIFSTGFPVSFQSDDMNVGI